MVVVQRGAYIGINEEVDVGHKWTVRCRPQTKDDITLRGSFPCDCPVGCTGRWHINQ